jgi:DNA-binding SARP family transcriptional activator
MAAEGTGGLPAPGRLGTASTLEIGVLGPLTVRAPGGTVDVPGRLARTLLVLLALQPGRYVSTGAIIARLWEEPPASARNTVQTYISHLRRALGGAGRGPAGARGDHLLHRDADAYRLCSSILLDSTQLATLALAARAASDPGERLVAADSALALWRGEPLSGLGDRPFVLAERDRLRELRRSVHARRVEALLDLRRPGEAVLAADIALGEQPYDEAMWVLAVLGRYRSGRPADALACCRQGCQLLADDLGLEPSAPLRSLERAVLTHDPALRAGHWPPAASPASVRPADPGDRIDGLRLVVAEDDLLVREGIVRILSAEDGFTVVAAVATHDEVLDAVRRCRPHVVVTDIRMPPDHRREGIAVAHELGRSAPDVAVVVLSQVSDPHYARDLFTPSAQRRAYVLKHHLCGAGPLVRAVRAVAGGESYVDPEIVDLLVTGTAGSAVG